MPFMHILFNAKSMLSNILIIMSPKSKISRWCYELKLTFGHLRHHCVSQKVLGSSVDYMWFLPYCVYLPWTAFLIFPYQGLKREILKINSVMFFFKFYLWIFKFRLKLYFQSFDQSQLTRLFDIHLARICDYKYNFMIS